MQRSTRHPEGRAAVPHAGRNAPGGGAPGASVPHDTSQAFSKGTYTLIVPPPALCTIDLHAHVLTDAIALMHCHHMQAWATWLRPTAGNLRVDCLAKRVCNAPDEHAMLQGVNEACVPRNDTLSHLFSVYIHPSPTFKGLLPGQHLPRPRDLPHASRLSGATGALWRCVSIQYPLHYSWALPSPCPVFTDGPT